MGTHYKGTEEEVRALDTFIKLLRAAESTTARLSRHMAAHRLTVSQFGAMEALLHLGPLCQCDLGKKLLKSSGNITMVVDNLEKQGFVERRREVEDRRFVTVHLTDKGQRFIAEIFPRHVAAIVEEMGALTPPEQEDLGRLCRKLGRREGDKKST
ncbi:MAG: MarR family transcriptional regulator [Candidatus Handelsmanbacteria bacterium RIFCSPLOWO2_12_FULL_64_10]|uniref:MarR family transcriptional regulator n=1 Tax=Handelsmanbacteria sp. (strain RIFCSPLOWO2_12_FULL_64_10) TaxID=1817868 RepID=A0A1F6C9L5_HANXR|nr:MAG: MarR family transcriptional regulator [Candidatus Handelsmanbacteria bacterium RIFCSPLOWO2_12_FULL_64_10]